MDMMLEKTVRRIEQMEDLFDQVQNTIKAGCCEDEDSLKERIQILRKYYESGQWLMDYECDERGELPATLKRGVLSQDGLYDLLHEIDIKYFKQQER